MLDGIPLGDLSAPAILTIVFLAVISGRLVPRKVLEDVIKERDAWREAQQKSEEARHADFEQKLELMEVARTFEHVMKSLPQPPGNQDA